jgi:EAL domain-containing protein (putative c-di-GMP-specific phosphodiesterase class I)
MAHRLLDELCEPVEAGGRTLRPRASVGVAIATGDAKAETLMRDADAAMYEAKARGPRAVWLADADVRDRAERRFRLDGALAEALVDDEYALAYQPVTDLDDGRLLGAEALLRWESTVFGSTAPAEIIPVAEETGVIHELTGWSTTRAARDLNLLRRAGLAGDDFQVGINMSCSQLSAPEFVDRYLATLAGEALRPRDLVLEVTETELIEVASAAADALHALASHGVPLALDDFGAGFSSFEYLTRLPVRYLKLDRSLIAHASRSDRARTVLTGIVTICEELDIITIAEGIESPAEREACLEAGIARGQGYLIAPPMPTDHLIRWRIPAIAVGGR